VPPLELFASADAETAAAEELCPGEVMTQPGSILLNRGRNAVLLTVTNTADRPIQVGSHFHMVEVNPYLQVRFCRDRFCATGELKDRGAVG
jgi:urease beta subunit